MTRIDFVSLVQDRASEMITHHDNAERMLAIGEELYRLATAELAPEPEPSIAEQILGREIYQETRKQDEREIRRIYNRKED